MGLLTPHLITMHNAQINFHGLNPLRPQATIQLTESNGEHNFNEYPLSLTLGKYAPSSLLGVKNTKIGYCKAQNEMGSTLYLACIIVNFQLPEGITLEEHFVAAKISPKNELEGKAFYLRGDWDKFDLVSVNTLKYSDIVFSLATEELLPYGFYFVSLLCEEDELEELFN
jgi:hypothetical protein